MPSASNADGIHELPPYLTVKEAAEYLRVNVKTVYAAIAARILRAVKFGRILRIPREALLALADGAVPPNPGSSRRGRRDR
jgi:excisionase family DNA binding protein